jgi:hypothetical protein
MTVALAEQMFICVCVAAVLTILLLFSIILLGVLVAAICALARKRSSKHYVCDKYAKYADRIK